MYSTKLRTTWFCQKKTLSRKLLSNVYRAQKIFTCSKAAIETIEKGISYVEN